MIGICINADTRTGTNQPCTTVGDFGSGSLQGCRSYDFLTDSVTAVHKFFEGHEHQITLCIDEHDPLPSEVKDQIEDMDIPLKTFVFRYNRMQHRFNDQLYIDSLRLLSKEAEYIVHVDQDCAMFRDANSKIIDQWFEWLETYKYICQPHNGGDKMWHASTRFFICKQETLDLDEAEKCLSDLYRVKKYGDRHVPALEHILGLLCNDNVLYPDPQNEEYLIFSWVRYHVGTMKKLMNMPYPEIQKTIESWGIHGANDVLSKEIP